jgi:hypothetical protein
MNRADPRSVPQRYPTYAENHCALRWPLLLCGIAGPAAVLAGVLLQRVTHSSAFGILWVVGVSLWFIGYGYMLPSNWPTGIRTDGSGIRIGGVRRAERHPISRPSSQQYQARQVFSCNWDDILSIDVVTGRHEMRKLRRTVDYRTEGLYSLVRVYPLGVLIAPYMKSALVIELEPGFDGFPDIRGRKRDPARSRLWIAPTRHPQQLRQALRLVRTPPPDQV